MEDIKFTQVRGNCDKFQFFYFMIILDIDRWSLVLLFETNVLIYVEDE